MVRVYMSKAMVDEHTMAIDKIVRQWGGVDDKAIRDGKLYSSKAPLQSLIGVPAYAVAKHFTSDKRVITHWLRIFGSVIFGLGLAFLLLAWCRRRAEVLVGDPGAGTGLGLSLALGTMVYPYTLTFTGHILAALTAGGCYLSIILILQAAKTNRAWSRYGVFAGLCAGAAPFAEYPAALVAAPALIGGFICLPNWPDRGRLFNRLAIGGLPPFLFGLWAHHESWGAFYKTGYSFLENKAYVQVHDSGFFGVTAPKLDAFLGALFSPGTGLFFYSPILLLGLIILIARIVKPPERESALGRNVALIALVGFILEILFISGHSGWRGGWTLGPRYIIPVVPLLSVWLAEGLGNEKLRPWINYTGALSIALTGFATALYPHLSDVYSNPLATFVFPSYLRGEFSYGLANAAGLSGHAANLVHLLPLAAALVYVACEGAWNKPRRLGVIGLGLILAIGSVGLIPEKDESAALRENERLWGFWEPSRPDNADMDAVYRARDRWRQVQVEAVLKGTKNEAKRRVACRIKPDRCEYGGQAWQHFKPDFLPFNGKHQPVLFIHPITGWTVRTRMIVPAASKSAQLTIGMTDTSADSDNQAPVRIHILADQNRIQEFELPAERGLKKIPIAFPANKPKSLTIGIESDKDGARVLGFDLHFFQTQTSTAS